MSDPHASSKSWPANARKYNGGAAHPIRTHIKKCGPLGALRPRWAFATIPRRKRNGTRHSHEFQHQSQPATYLLFTAGRQVFPTGPPSSFEGTPSRVFIGDCSQSRTLGVVLFHSVSTGARQRLQVRPGPSMHSCKKRRPGPKEVLHRVCTASACFRTAFASGVDRFCLGAGQAPHDRGPRGVERPPPAGPGRPRLSTTKGGARWPS